MHISAASALFSLIWGQSTFSPGKIWEQSAFSPGKSAFSLDYDVFKSLYAFDPEKLEVILRIKKGVSHKGGSSYLYIDRTHQTHLTR